MRNRLMRIACGVATVSVAALRDVADLGVEEPAALRAILRQPNAVFSVSWNFVRKVTTASSVYGPIGTIITARNSMALDVAQIGQIDLTWDMTRFVQLLALYSRTFASQYIKDAGGRSFEDYRLRIMARW